MSSAASRPPYTASPSPNLSMGQSQNMSQSIGQSANQSVGQSTSQVTGQGANQSTSRSAGDSKTSLRKPPARSLIQPPARPKPPKPATPAPKPEASVEPEKPQRPGPISLPSEPMQYRAIGLVKGKYIASEEQFNRGDIQVEDGTLIDAVLLGRTTSLIKKHLDLEKEHLWVVYPRTLLKEADGNDMHEKSADDTSTGEASAKEESAESDAEGTEAQDALNEAAVDSKAAQSAPKGSAPKGVDNRLDRRKPAEDKVPALHVQIVGVWEPETLNSDAMSTEDEASRPLSSEEAADQCDRFSIRGEVAKYSEEDKEIIVSIVQKSKSESAKPKRPFKLQIEGTLRGRTVGYFWDFWVERQDGKLLLKEGTPIAVVPPKRKSKSKKGGRRRPSGPGKPRSASSAPKPKPKAKAAEPTTTKAVSEASEG